jgi:hypothetical protein
VNVLLACGWKSHTEHAHLLAWLLQEKEWATCPLIESGFMRISMTTAYQASFEDARKSLATLRHLHGHQFLSDDVEAVLLPVLTSYKDTTDALPRDPGETARIEAGYIRWHVDCEAVGRRSGGESVVTTVKILTTRALNIGFSAFQLFIVIGFQLLIWPLSLAREVCPLLHWALAREMASPISLGSF